MAPQVGLEPTTLRLTAECSAIELLRNMESGGDLLSRAVTSQVPSALKGLTSVFGMGTGGTPSSLPPEMVSYFGKPFSFLYCVSVNPGLPVFRFFLLQAWRCFHTLTTAQYRFSIKDCFQLISESRFCNQALDRLVSSSSIRYRTSTDDLSTLSSSRGLTCLRSGNSLDRKSVV